MAVRWTRLAADDLSPICDHTEKRFGAGQAQRTALALYDGADSLHSMPLSGPVGRRPGTRELMIGGLPFVIIYRVCRDEVEVVRILHGSQRRP